MVSGSLLNSYSTWVEQRRYVWNLERKVYLGSELKFSFIQIDNPPLDWSLSTVTELLQAWKKKKNKKWKNNRDNSKDSLDFHLPVCYINGMITFSQCAKWSHYYAVGENGFKLEIMLYSILSAIFMKVLFIISGKIIKLQSWKMCFIL